MRKIILLLVFFSIIIHAQKNSIRIGNMDVKLGMTESEFYKVMEANNFTMATFNTDMDKYNNSLNTYKNDLGFVIIKDKVIYGSVYFEDNRKLCYIKKEWIVGNNNISSYDFISILYNVINNGFGIQKINQTITQVSEIMEPTINLKTITVVLGKSWQVVISNRIQTQNNEKFQSINISEIIGELPKRLFK